MDLPLYARVLWRHKRLLIGGFTCAVLLALIAFVRINPVGHPKISYRQHELWVSDVTLLVSQEGFPWGRSTLTGAHAGDPGRFSDLAILYAHLATSDDVMNIMKREAPVKGKLLASEVTTQDNAGNALPLVDISAIATSKAGALRLARRETGAFLTFLRQQQVANRIGPSDRVIVTVVNSAQKPKLFAGRSKVPPILAFVLIMAATVAAAFMLENVRPRVRAVKAEAPVARGDTSRISA
jgi:hypothetical protein